MDQVFNALLQLGLFVGGFLLVGVASSVATKLTDRCKKHEKRRRVADAIITLIGNLMILASIALLVISSIQEGDTLVFVGLGVPFLGFLLAKCGMWVVRIKEKRKIRKPESIPNAYGFFIGGDSVGEKDSKIIQFLCGRPVEAGGKTMQIDTIWNYDHTQLEQEHDFIQWLFPTDEASDFNPNAPVLTLSDIETIRKNPFLQTYIIYSLLVMLNFYGFRHDSEAKKIFQVRPEAWPPTPHNYLRITRILKCLTLCGLQDYAKAFYDALMEVKDIEKTTPKATLEFWKNAVESAENV